jgi:hypothetical protein
MAIRRRSLLADRDALVAEPGDDFNLTAERFDVAAYGGYLRAGQRNQAPH